jgi:uncharacterized protein
MTALARLHDDIDQRVASIRHDYPDWPCRGGCEGCCHKLADIPQLTSAEWALLQLGLEQLTPKVFLGIQQNIAALAMQAERPIVCPLLDRAHGLCRVYAYRPTACRSYGFYVQRDQGLYCAEINSLQTSGLLNGVVWGNHDVIDRHLRDIGPNRSLTHWFVDTQVATLLKTPQD